MDLAIKNIEHKEISRLLNSFIKEYLDIEQNCSYQKSDRLNVLFVKYLHEFLKDSDIYYNYFRYKENFFGEKIREWKEKGKKHRHTIKDLVFDSNTDLAERIGNLCSLFVEKLYLDGFNYIKCLIEYSLCKQDIERPEEFILNEKVYFLEGDYLTPKDIEEYELWICQAYFNEINGSVNWKKYIKWASNYCGQTNEADFLFYDVIMAYWSKEELKENKLTNIMIEYAIKNYEEYNNTNYLYERLYKRNKFYGE